jgi:drug/metabolite transporter (DMT)-like permease
MNKKIDITATYACVGFLLCWSTGPIFVKLLTGYTDASVQNFLRYAVACVFWLPYLLWCLSKGTVDRGIWWRALLPAGTNLISQTLWTIAFYNNIDPAFMSLIDKTSILWIAVFSFIIFPGERVLLRSKRFWSAAALSIAGITGVLVFKEGFGSQKTLVGVVLSMISSVIWGVHVISVKILFKNVDSRQGFSVISIYSVIGFGIMMMFSGKTSSCLSLGAAPWLYIIASSVFGLAICNVLYYSAIRRIGATIPSLVVLAAPFLVILFSKPIFNESLNIFQWLCGLMLLAGIAIDIWAQEHLKPETASNVETIAETKSEILISKSETNPKF